ncbi:uncharacterized protein LOC117180413 [Belonocnema kinseyi]|uniref:uncharacterized protein LOC117180413 n=1 Tax=Belonocnema kinseyi TaxID=2817044 RepID=UPI00143DBC5F|nr:uncharacterized protein LOC117180413 [Belonocnema kinseyi]
MQNARNISHELSDLLRIESVDLALAQEPYSSPNGVLVGLGLSVRKAFKQRCDDPRAAVLAYNERTGVTLLNHLTLLLAAIRRVAPSKWGLSYRTMKIIYGGLFKAIAGYAVAAWFDLTNEYDRRTLRSAQRQALLAMTRAYRTASTDALCVLAGEAPISLFLTHRVAQYNIRKGRDVQVADLTIESDQLGDDSASLVDDKIKDLWQRQWSFLTGHGDFSANLWRRPSLKLRSATAANGGDRQTHSNDNDRTGAEVELLLARGRNLHEVLAGHSVWERLGMSLTSLGSNKQC